jgi:CAP-Gly domain-containing linker protein 1
MVTMNDPSSLTMYHVICLCVWHTVGGGQSSIESTDDFRIGDRVWVGGNKPGIIVYIGEVHFSTGDWAGVVLDTPTGKNNGTVNGRQYFQCEPNRGVFSRLNKLTRSPTASGKTLPSESAPDIQIDDSKPTAGKTGLPEVKTVPSDKSSSPRGLRPVAAENHIAVFPTDSTGSDNGITPAFNIGDRVTVSGYKTGTLRYLGTTDFASGIWAGVELDEPVGKNDGCVAGTR